jgi:hypothetical protein
VSKLCRCCGETKLLSEFVKKCDTFDGVASRCRVCQSTAKRARYRERAGQVQALNRVWYANNREKVVSQRKAAYVPGSNKLACKEYYERNKEILLASNVAWAKANPNKIKQAYQDYSARHKEVRNAGAAVRRARKRNAFANWDRDFTLFVGKEAAHLAHLRKIRTGVEWHVDHEIPLAGKFVSGLHTWNNLRVIPAIENIRKGNSFGVVLYG